MDASFFVAGREKSREGGREASTFTEFGSIRQGGSIEVHKYYYKLC